MKKKYTPPTITVMSIECDGNHLLAGSDNPNTGMNIPTESTPGVEGDAKEGFFDFDGFHLEEIEE
ncbi:hypothetical protein E5358_13180 [Palleniella muris]|uniref:Uncharacterized protein n=1 Tax=Palleniella muris TaxID=3038145 RepID=A0AC61QM83_9BACT|nr:hypothetical protein [Palleniella muris]TGX80305.1 hypothetical protein E5358_13180 [Palleniella muris]